jgi:hypothetical protein
MPLVAFTTFAIFRAPPGDPQVQGFFDRLPDTFGAADRFEGFVARSMRDPVTLTHTWGDLVYPRFLDPAQHDGAVATLSLWRTLESVNAFAYSGVHGESLRHRLEWFVKPEWPSYTAWWVADDHIPDWYEARERLEHLHDHGPSPQAFDFRRAFGADRDPIMVQRDAVREIVSRASIDPQIDSARLGERDAIVQSLKAGSSQKKV